MDKKALELCSRFAYSPNKLGYCGLESANKAFLSCLVKGECDEVGREIQYFKGLYPYLKTLGDVTGKDKYSYDVVEAYWLGNDLLGKFRADDYGVLIKNLKAQRLPDFFIDEVARNKPNAFVPLHLFNVLHIGVGKITGSVPFNLESINNCMVRWGEVLKVNKSVGGVELRLKEIKKVGNGFGLTEITEVLKFDGRFVRGIKKNDVVAVHWNGVCKILTDREWKNLEKWTRTVIEGVNQMVG